MTEYISFSIEDAELWFNKFVERFPLKSIPKFYAFHKSLSISENLNDLALFALQPSTTVPVLYSCKDIVVDLTARWVTDYSGFERKFKQKHGVSNYIVPGSIILSGLARLVKLHNESINTMEYFLTRINILASLPQHPSISSQELEVILLAFYRLLSYDRSRFNSFIAPQVLYAIINNKSPELNVSRYLSIRVLSLYLNSSEAAEERLLSHHFDQDTNFISTYECDQNIDYKLLDLLEAKRLSNYFNLPPKVDSMFKSSTHSINIPISDLHPSTISICGILVSNFMVSSSDAVNNTHNSNYVPTESSVKALREIAQSIQNNKPIMLYGKAGSGKTFLINQLAQLMSKQNSIVKIHLGEQTDAKLLLGTYSSGEKPGTFQWMAGVLTTAVKEGKWVLVEDIDKAPTEVLSILLTLLEKKELTIPSRGEVIKAKNGFQLISTIRISNDSSNDSIPDMIGSRLWEKVKVTLPTQQDLRNILLKKFPLLENFLNSFIKCYNEVIHIYSLPSFISLNKGSNPRVISFRDLMKFCSRCNKILINEGVTHPTQLLESSVYDGIFAEAVDCYGSAITEASALTPLVNSIGSNLEIPTSRVQLFLHNHVPTILDNYDEIRIGRSVLVKSETDKALYNNKKSQNITSFARTNHSLRLMEQIGVSIQMGEPTLLVGETGTGKTTVVQQMAQIMNKKLIVINVSQQTESGDLLGGYKPISAKSIAIPIQETFENLFLATFSEKKNEKFSQMLSKCFNKSQWNNVLKLWREALRMARDILKTTVSEEQEEAPKKKRRLNLEQKSILSEKWLQFETEVKDFELQAGSVDSSFSFKFVEGSLVKAVREGNWLLLDEINLASPDTLESISDLLAEAASQRSLLLTEKGDVESITAHPEFRIFGCMNPSTDIGKRDLPQGIRSRFSEIYVHSPDRDINDLLAIIDKYINRYALGDEWIGNDIAELYLEAKSLSFSNKIVDGANQRPHFSIRTLTRTLLYVRDIVAIYGLRRSLYEGFCMSFLTLLDIKSEKLLEPLIYKYTVGKLKNPKSVMHQIPPVPTSSGSDYVQFKHYWLKRGPEERIDQPHYIITPFVEKNMLNLVRAIAGERFPILIQGPTSAGKTSMIQYLATISGHKFVRINNHEHTDLQEYLGTYVSDSSGKLTFKEGVLVEALRKGHWLVLDELNLAPTDVLEALNRLLDDNRELFIPETQEVVHPHPDFMIFATQNPPGLYGGRKILSRAFRNRFLELHFDDIPQDELEIILKERCQIAPSYGKKIVEVYKELSVQRQSTRLFEQKNSFATLRDLFRWAQREAVGYEELAANGYMLLAERVRKEEERQLVKATIEKVMKVQLDMEAYYEKLEDKTLFSINSNIVWTKAMRRLAVLVSTSMKYREPLLLVGETGCGKTTVCQIIAQHLQKQLITVNAHQNTETGDLLGAQRPVRSRQESINQLYLKLANYFNLSTDEYYKVSVDDLLIKFEARKAEDHIDENFVKEIDELKKKSSILFEWSDGPLIQAMKQGDFFLLDEISLADDSVLERLNSVLEPERTILLAEKGTEDSFITGAAGFEFLATMNPGGDYGKKELSPALRNRFTEIWVPSMEDFDDVKQIVHNRLTEKTFTESIVSFSKWFAQKFGGGHTNSGVISLRDILAWVEFINSCSNNIDKRAALLHGASMVFIDALGTNNTAHLAENEEKLKALRLECISTLSDLYGSDLASLYLDQVKISVNEEEITAGLFSVPIIAGYHTSDSFNLHAPTTASNTMRVVRAMQVSKPILLEGSPGVGKTSLVSALAKATGNELVRINLSEQTDLIDLFGSDAPTDGGKAGEFAWRDAPFLRAMKLGEWVLLDEMNLASQSVLEGLNACLDHRGEAYIPELDKSFPRHQDFKVFAAQNPQYQGGGRKGLPKSFVNRFSVVYVDTLKLPDLKMIAEHLYPGTDKQDISKMIGYVSKIEEEVVIRKSWGSSGGPWEFNLRDTLRWLELYNSKGIAGVQYPEDFIDMVISGRFRSSEDREKAHELFNLVFGQRKSRDNYFGVGSNYLQSSGAYLERSVDEIFNESHDHIPLECNFELVEIAIRCVNYNIPLILTGPTHAGKTELIRFLATASGAKLEEFAMNNDVDSMDILGGYEQVDLTRELYGLISKIHDTIIHLLVSRHIYDATSQRFANKALEVISFINNESVDIKNYTVFHNLLSSLVSLLPEESLQSVLKDSSLLIEKLNTEQSIKFKWFDGLLVKAVERGNWLVLDNANLCNPSVLDRLNSLLETNGTLIVNECSAADGSPRVITPHPNFRLFLTVNPRYGELSRAMRNRGVEVFIDSLDERATTFDRAILKLAPKVSATNLTEQFDDLSFSKVTQTPSVSFLSPRKSRIRPLVLLDDAFESGQICLEKYNASLSIITLSTIPEIEMWKHTILNSSEFDNNYKNEASDINDIICFLSQNGILKVISDAYASSFSEHDLVHKNLDVFANNQSLHLLLNDYLNHGLQKNSPFINSSESTLLYSIAISIIESDKLVEEVQFKALEGKIADLTYLQKSAAYHLGRNIKAPPRLSIFKFLRDLNLFIKKVFLLSTQSLFQVGGIYKALVELQLMWKGLFDCSREKNESRIRIYQDLISSWSEANETNEFLNCHLIELKDIIEEFGKSLELTRGHSIHLIWDKFRNNYPQTESSWNDAILLFELCNDFDEVASSQFIDSRTTILEFRKMMVDLYASIVNGNITSGEFLVLYKTLSTGISDLRNVSEKFIIQRRNNFKSEFALVSYYKQAEDGNTDKEGILDLAFLSGGATKDLLYLSDSNDFKSYPLMLNRLWKNQNDSTHSLVSSTLSNDLLDSVLTKVDSLSSQPGKYLPQILEDLTILGSEIVKNSQAILSDQKQALCTILFGWIVSLSKAHSDSYATAELDLLDRAIAEKVEPKEFINALLTSKDEWFGKIALDYFSAAIILASEATSLSHLGKAWVLFSCGAIQLFVPNSSIDPAIREYVLFQKFEDQKQSSARLVDSWKSIRKLVSGDKSLKLEQTIPKVEEIDVPQKPRVFRRDESIDFLFEEWKSFMDSSIDEEPLKILLNQATELTDLGSQMIQLFQNNSSQFLFRLETNFTMYSDVNEILSGYIYGLKLGFDLIEMEKRQQGAEYNYDFLWSIDLSRMVSPTNVIETFQSAKELSKSIGLDFSGTEYLMLFFINLSFVHSDVKTHGGEVQVILSQALQTLYYRWSLRRMKEAEENEQKGNLYKHSHVEEDAEEDFKKLFPDYENVLDIDLASKKKNESFEQVYFLIARAYLGHFVNGKTKGLSELIKEGGKLNSILNGYKENSLKFGSNPSVLSSLIHEIVSSYNEFSSPIQDFNFYKDGSSFEFKRAIVLISSIQAFVQKLLLEWPEHATLQHIASASEEFLMYPSNHSVSRLLQKIEQIYTLVAEWQKYASSQVSLKPQFDELTNLIVSWRKLELSSWKGLFRNEELDQELKIGKWWFHLFEAIIVPLLSGDEISNHQLLSTLNIFMSKATFGEYVIQLDLMKAFKNHVGVISPESQIYSSLSNFITFYDQFTSIIKDGLESSKKRLGKDVTEVILLASWKDVNIDALKQSARRSHASLYKIIRKYRQALNQPVKDIIEAGLTPEKFSEVSLLPLPRYIPAIYDDNAKELCQKVASFAARPKRLQDSTLIEKNMSLYVSQIEKDELPTLYDYAKEIVEQMELLRKETPSQATDKNKKLIAALKTQKRKLLSDTLKELRRIGLSTAMKTEVIKSQATVNTILSNCANFDALLEGSDVYFFRILDMLPRLRAAINNLSEDVPQVDAEKGLAAAENLLHTLILTKHPLSKLSSNVSKLHHLYDNLHKISVTNDNIEVSPISKLESINLNIENIRFLLVWLPKYIDFTTEVGQAAAKLGGKISLEILDSFKSKFIDLNAELTNLSLDLATSECALFISAFVNVYDNFLRSLVNWKRDNIKYSFVVDGLLQWNRDLNFTGFVETSTSISNINSLTDIEMVLRDLSNSILVVVQQVSQQNTGEISEDDDKWLAASQQRLNKYVKSLHIESVISRIERALDVIKRVEHNAVSSNIASALINITMPLIQNFVALGDNLLEKSRSNYFKTSKATFILSSSLLTLATKGFCAPEPPSEQKEDNNLQDGTGLGDGEGANNASNDVEDDEDLTEDAQKPNEDQKEKEEGEEENDDAVDIEGDMAGDLEEASDQEDDAENEEDQEELDEEIDDIDDLDINAVDEKMWDEEAKDDKKEKDSDKIPENSNNNEEMEANEDDAENANEDNKNDPKDGNDDKEENENEEDAEDEEDVGEMDDEVNHDDNEKLEDNVPETETLELPEDMNLDDDGEEEEGNEDNEDDTDLDDKMDMDIDEEEKPSEENNEEIEADEDKNPDDTASQDEETEEQDESVDDKELNEEPNEEPNEEGKEEDDSEETVKEEKEKDEEEGGNDGQIDQETADGADGINEDTEDNDVDIESAVKQEFGEKGSGSDNQVADDNNDIGASGSAASDPRQQEIEEDSSSKDDARESAKESLKQLGDALKEFHRRRQDIKDVAEEDKTEQEQSANERPDEFQHVEGENADFDTQALGAADKDQIQKIDDDKAIDDDQEVDDQEVEPVKEEVEIVDTDAMDVDENQDQGDSNPDADIESKNRGAMVGERKDLTDNADVFADEDIVDEEMEEENVETILTTVDQHDLPPIDIEDARNSWKHSEISTSELASGLCEQLRLILEPTLATKLKGDYKTGKRLNMKRIIPYIASDFRKDKIWLRRTKPSKREYQIMIAVDDSKSMSESKSTELAFHSIALVSKALTQLESGGLSIVRFGEDIKVVHPFDKPFSQETGAQVFQWFDFQQSRTDITKLCQKSFEIFESSRSGSNSELWQLQIILSDGVCEDHETVQRLVRKARDEKIMMVFVVMDGINSNESIMDMSQVSYVQDPNTGAMNLKVDKYLDSFPFEYYVIVRDITELPEMLALILRQYFSELASSR